MTTTAERVEGERPRTLPTAEVAVFVSPGPARSTPSGSGSGPQWAR